MGILNDFQMRTRERIPGLPLIQFVYGAFLFAALTVASTIAVVAAIVMTQSTFSNPVVATLAAIEAACLVGGGACMYFGNLALKAEIAAGYTTSRFGYPHLELVDPSTNLIVRSAGEPLISREEYRRRVQAYRTTMLKSDDA